MTIGRSPSEIGAWCEANGVDAWFRHGGDLAVATAPRHEGSWHRMLETARELGVESEYEELSKTCGDARRRGSGAA